MKLRFNSFDIVCGVTELQCLLGLRVNQIYDVDNKTYLIRLQGGGETKKVLLIESGIRFHTTAFDWPKNIAPSGFSMKLRKHLKNKRLEKLQQLGVDRIVDFQFGTGEAAYHIILELYDRGNIVLTDHNLTILYILRSHQEGEDVCFAVRERYPIERAKKPEPLPNEIILRDIIAKSSAGESLKRIVMPLVDCGPTVIEHVLRKYNFENCIIPKESVEIEKHEGSTCSADNKSKINSNKNGKREFTEKVNYREFDIENGIKTLMQALQDVMAMMENARITVSKGYILQKKEEKPVSEVNHKIEHYYQNVEYHPYNFCKFEGQLIVEFETFMKAVDEFYSTLESQKIDMKTMQQQREALKKLSNVKKDHAKRLEELNKAQQGDKQKAELITMNQGLVDNAILAIRSAIANQMSWPDIHELVKTAQINGDPVASSIKQLKLEINHISLKLSDPYMGITDVLPITVDVDLALSAWANARKYYDQKRYAAQKEQKTIDASQKALKSAERKTQQALKEIRTISTISKARKVYWFEKFYWFISSENFLVIGGRDAQQNELIVKRYMRSTDIYVHAEIQGASSVIVRNPKGGDVPPKTLLEAGTMAISYSVAWDAKVVTNAYWVHSNQVSKTAPSGEYLGTGSFMIRGKKNFLPSCHLIMGLTLLFKLEDSFIEKHRGDRKVRSFEEDQKLLIVNEVNSMTLDNKNIYDISETELEDDDCSDKRDKNIRYETPNVSENEFDRHLAKEFPDVQLKVEHDTGRITVTNELLKVETSVEPSVIEEQSNMLLTKEELEESVIIIAAASRKKQQQNSKKRREEKNRKTQKDQNQLHLSTETAQRGNSTQSVKRGQKGKLKKIKAKYKDQDDEERQMRMQILHSAGKNNRTTSDNNVEDENLFSKISKPKHEAEPHHIQNGEVEDVDDMPTGADVEMLDSLTGVPLEDDELLFAIPMVAPYQALQNYKYKVKLTPGTGKRGRAAKTALTIFSKDKACTSRERDLLKSVREETLARNIPGKVKLSAPQLLKFKK